MDIKKYKKLWGFTLVELIVVITILSILWSIAFLSFQDFAKDARDSKRISDISNFEKWLEIYRTNTWKYPFPDNYITISESWEDLVYQWKIWETLSSNLKISKELKDPKTLINYDYSISQDKKSYEVWYNLESSIVSISNISYADNELSVIKWNYNWLFIKTKTNRHITMPSLISDISVDTSITTLWTELINFKKDWNSDFLAFTPDLVSWDTPTEFISNLKTEYTWNLFSDTIPAKKLLALNEVDNSQIQNAYSSLNWQQKNLYKESWAFKWNDWNYPTSCKWYNDDYSLKNKINWKYWIKPIPGESEFIVDCDMTTNWGWWTRYASIKWNYTFDSAYDCVMTSNIISTDNLECFNPYRKGIVWWELMVVDNDDSKEKYFSQLDWSSNYTDKSIINWYHFYWNKIWMSLMTNGTYMLDYSWEKLDTKYVRLWLNYSKNRKPWGIENNPTPNIPYMNYSYNWLWWPNSISWSNRESTAKKFDFYIKEPASFVKWYDSCKAISEAWESNWNGQYYITPTWQSETLIYCDMNNISNLRLYFDMTTVNSSWNLYDLSWNWYEWVPLNSTVIWNDDYWIWAGSTLFSKTNKDIIRVNNTPDILWNWREELTVSIYIMPYWDISNNRYILEEWTSFDLYSSDTNNLISRIVTSNYPDAGSIPEAAWNYLTIDKWNHVVMTFKNWLVKTYVNWISVNNDSQSTWTIIWNWAWIAWYLNIWWYEYPSCLSSNNCFYSNSYIDQVMIYDKALSDNEIKAINKLND